MRTPTDAPLLQAAARLADMTLDPARAEQLAPAMDGFYALLDLLHAVELGETPPAFAFDARWAQR